MSFAAKTQELHIKCRWLRAKEFPHLRRISLRSFPGVGVLCGHRIQIQLHVRRKLVKKQSLRNTEITQGIVVWHIAVVTPEKMDTLPGKCVAVAVLRPHRKHPLRRVPTRERNGATAVLRDRL